MFSSSHVCWSKSKTGQNKNHFLMGCVTKLLPNIHFQIFSETLLPSYLMMITSYSLLVICV